MISNIIDYFVGLNRFGQALFVVGSLLVLTFIILLITILKPEKNKMKKVYSENALVDKENTFEEKMRNIDSINETDINLENDKTKNLKVIVDQLKELEEKNNGRLDEIQKYEAEQEDTAIISVEELMKKAMHQESKKQEDIEILDFDEKPTPVAVEQKIEEVQVINQDRVISQTSYQETKTYAEEKVEEPQRYTPKQEVFSSVFGTNNRPANTNTNNPDNETFLNSLKEFRNNL